MVGVGLSPHPSVQIAASVSSDEPRVTLKPLFHSGSLRKNMKHINYILNAASPVDVSISILTVMLTSYWVYWTVLLTGSWCKWSICLSQITSCVELSCWQVLDVSEVSACRRSLRLLMLPDLFPACGYELDWRAYIRVRKHFVCRTQTTYETKQSWDTSVAVRSNHGSLQVFRTRKGSGQRHL